MLTFYPSQPTLGRMPTQDDADRTELLQGTLDLLVLRTLRRGRQHGQRVARAIVQNSREMLLAEHGSLYHAFQRLEANGWIHAELGVSENKRRARFYELTKEDRQQLVRETGDWHKLVRALGFVLGEETAHG
jgi:PadR family transcriptional regulator PadR